MKAITSLLLLFTSTLVWASQSAVMYDIKVYQISDTDWRTMEPKTLLTEATLLHSPSLLVYPGEQASLEIGNERAQLQIAVESNPDASLYSVELKSKSNQSQDWSNASFTTPKTAMGGQIVFKAELNDEVLLIQSEARIVDIE